MNDRVAALRRQCEETPIEIWGEDESRLGLQPIVRRVWAKKGCRPVARRHPRYKWVYGFCFVHPSTGGSYWNLRPTVSIRVMNIALSEFAKAVNPGNKKRILLLVDRAGFHTGKALVIPDGIEFVYLPPYTPELEPAARIWPLLRESVANRVFKTLDALEAVSGAAV